MLRAIVPICAVMGVVVAAEARAQTPADSRDASAAVAIKHKLMYLKLGLGEGLTGVSVHRDGRPLELDFFGTNADDFFNEVPEALAAARSYRTEKTVGFTLWGIGLAALLADLIYVVSSVPPDGKLASLNQVVVWGLLGGGIATGLAGSILIQTSISSLSEAVNKYNAGILNEYLPPQEKIELHLLASGRQTGLELRLQF